MGTAPRHEIIGIMSPLPDDVERIFDHLGSCVELSGHLKWNEKAKIKADMTNVRRRWLNVNVSEYRERCRAAGMTSGETAEMVDYLQRTQAGRRLIADRSYREHRFKPEPE